MNGRHHMDGATANQENRFNHNNSYNTINNNNNTTNGKADSEDNNNHHGNDLSPMTTLKMKLPDVRQGGNTIQISLEVGGVLYEGKISAKLSPVTTNGHYDVTTSEANEPMNGE